MHSAQLCNFELTSVILQKNNVLFGTGCICSVVHSNYIVILQYIREVVMCCICTQTLWYLQFTAFTKLG